MQTNKLILLKQTLFLSIMLVINYWTIIVYSEVNIYNNISLFGILLEPIIWFIFIITLFIFTPLTVLLFWRLNKGGDLKILNKIFRIICASILIIFATTFILTIGEQLYWRMPGLGFWYNLWYLITSHLSWSYFSDINYGFIEDVKQILVYLPHLIIAALLYSAFRTNELLDTAKI